MVPPCSDRISRVPPYSRINWSLRVRDYHPLWPDFPDRSACPQLTTGLFRVRSPLLTESLLMSVPPGTEMFQFPGFASYHYGFMVRYPFGWVAPFGHPRIKACSRLPVAFRSVPRPSSPPGAKASTECPYHTPIQWSESVVSVTVASCQRQKAADHQHRNHSTRGKHLRSRTRGEPRSSPRSFRSDLNHFRHGTRTVIHSLRRMDAIRINSHKRL